MARRRTSTADILAQIPAARARAKADRKAGLLATAVRYDRRTGRIMIELTNGNVFGFPAASIPALASATPAQRAKVHASGYGLHWEALDIDLSVPDLLFSAIGRKAHVRELARIAGQTTSGAKAVAARANGAKGGRPRRSA